MPEMFCSRDFRDKAKARNTATGNLGKLGETGNSDTKIRAPKQVGSCQSLQSENVQFSGMHLGNKCVGRPASGRMTLLTPCVRLVWIVKPSKMIWLDLGPSGLHSSISGHSVTFNWVPALVVTMLCKRYQSPRAVKWHFVGKSLDFFGWPLGFWRKMIGLRQGKVIQLHRASDQEPAKKLQKPRQPMQARQPHKVWMDFCPPH